MKFRWGFLVSAVIVALSLLVIVNYKSITSNLGSTGDVVLFWGYGGLVLGLASMVPLALVYSGRPMLAAEKKEEETDPKKRWKGAICDLFICAYAHGGNIDDRKLQESAKQLAEESKELAQKYNLKLRSLDEDNAAERLEGFVRYIQGHIKHTAHVGTRYVIGMAKDLVDGHIDEPDIALGAFKFLSDLRPEVYGLTAKDLYKLLKVAVK
jgi:hypothetical protein